MKLVLCTKCQDIVRLMSKGPRWCVCHRSGGQYLDDILAEYWGRWAIPLGINNHSLVDAIQDQPKFGLGTRFDAFVIPKECPTFKKVKKP